MDTVPGTGTGEKVSKCVRGLVSLFYINAVHDDNDVITLLFLIFLNTYEIENQGHV